MLRTYHRAPHEACASPPARITLDGMRGPPTKRARRLRSALLLAGVFGVARSATATEPWSDPDPPAPPSRITLTPESHIGFRGAAEYRVQATSITPLDLQASTDQNLQIVEQRLRLDATVDYDDKVHIVTSADLLSGVLWGDNGTLGGSPEPTSGAAVTTDNPNLSTACITLKQGAPVTEASSYHYGLCSADPVFIRHAYGDVMTPVGLLRIGRQAMTDGASIAVNDGEGRKNRFGVADIGNSADRILFATKPLEAWKRPSRRDLTLDKGLFVILAYDRLVTNDPMQYQDDLHNVIAAIRYRAPRLGAARDFEAQTFYAYRFSTEYTTQVSAIGGRLAARVGDFTFGGETTGVFGSTTEVSEALSVINDDPITAQTVRAIGARGVARWDKKLVSLYFETDYASGNGNPNPGAPLTQFRFAEDTNVGLLMFKEALAYQSARAAAAGVATLQQLGAKDFPVQAISTNGSFTNAFALFPQVDVHPVKNLLLRGGFLVAWAPAPVVDPIASLEHNPASPHFHNGIVNYVGGAPDRFYGTELDGRIQYKLWDHFAADLEGAVLFPGSALQDANGDAVRSFLVQARGTFYL
jgi:hypothetical protein